MHRHRQWRLRLLHEHCSWLPAGTWLAWGGQFENLERARGRLALVVPLCFILIVFLLYSALKSWRATGIVFTCALLALVGGIAALWLREIPFSISAAVGFIAMWGVAVLNGMVMAGAIDGLAYRLRWGQAVREGALGRLRPFLITALVASLGFVPMAPTPRCNARSPRRSSAAWCRAPC